MKIIPRSVNWNDTFSCQQHSLRGWFVISTCKFRGSNQSKSIIFFLLLPNYSYLFWTDGCKSNNRSEVVKIERSGLAGNNRTVLFSTDLVCPTKLAVDEATGILYWLDAAASTVGSVNSSGATFRVSVRNEFATKTALTLYSVGMLCTWNIPYLSLKYH